MRLALVSLLVLAAACGSDGDGATTAGTGTGTTTGGGGAPPSCSSDDECPPASGCTTPRCSGGVCEQEPVPAGTPAAQDFDFGDCRRLVCAADGTAESEPDNTDLPNDWNPCTDDACTAGAPVFTSVLDGTSCGLGGSAVTCMGGACQGCKDDGECPEGDVCHTPVCDLGEVCGLEIDVGKVVSDVDPEDCWHAVCDTTGAITVVPVDDGLLCGGSSFCHPRRCDAGACSAEADPLANAVDPTAPAGDCRSTVCDGDGGSLEINDDSDAPSDPSPDDCTFPTCSGGVVGTTNHPAGTPCVGGTANTCDGAGTCT